MRAALTAISALLGSWLVAFALLIAVEMFSAVVHPFPADFKGTTEEVCRHVERYPGWVLAVVIPMWGGIAGLATWIAGRWGNLATSGLTAVLLVAAVVANVLMLPYPLWFKLLQPAAAIAATIWAVKTTRRPATTPPVE